MSRPVIVATLGNTSKVLIRMGAEGGAVDVYRLYLGRWDEDAASRGITQVTYDALTNVVTLEHNGRTERGTKVDPRDAKRLLAMFPAPWVEQEEAWDEGDEANFRDTAAADLRAQRAEERELKGE
jgi:hypothetical protein